MLRGVSFDYMGSVVFFVDLLHDRSIQPSHSIPAIAHLHTASAGTPARSASSSQR